MAVTMKQWKEHVLRMPPCRLPKLAVFYKSDGTGDLGGPRRRRTDQHNRPIPWKEEEVNIRYKNLHPYEHKLLHGYNVIWERQLQNEFHKLELQGPSVTSDEVKGKRSNRPRRGKILCRSLEALSRVHGHNPHSSHLPLRYSNGEDLSDNPAKSFNFYIPFTYK
ncbi:hypothetical protein C0J52_05287 [Blattella germanica]|nr:hypothetical protein C0J52_05287 [Blattella germanica]